MLLQFNQLMVDFLTFNTQCLLVTGVCLRSIRTQIVFASYELQRTHTDNVNKYYFKIVNYMEICKWQIKLFVYSLICVIRLMIYATIPSSSDFSVAHWKQIKTVYSHWRWLVSYCGARIILIDCFAQASQ